MNVTIADEGGVKVAEAVEDDVNETDVDIAA